VLVSLVVIFVPMLMEDPVSSSGDLSNLAIPERPPAVKRAIESREILPSPILSEPQQETEVEEPEESGPVAEAPPAEGSQVGHSTPVAWMVQVASFSQRENADKLVQRLRNAGLAAHQVEVRVEGKRRYRVQMPPQVDRKQAEALQQRIKKEFKLSARLVRYSG
jgi:DedD protein